MTQEEKQLLLKDLCSRLPYGVKVEIDGYYTHVLKGIDGDLILTDKGINYPIRLVKPYFRSLSTMAEDEKQELLQLLVGERDAKYFQVNTIGITNTDTDVQVGPNWIYHFMNFSFENISLCHDYLISHYFDVFKLILRGLAYEAPKGMYK